MTKTDINILILEESDVDFERVSSCLKKIKSLKFNVTRNKKLKEIAASKTQDIVLLADMFDKVDAKEMLTNHLKFSCPIIVLSQGKSRKTDIELLQSGTSDFLYKNKLEYSYLERSIRYSLERYKLIEDSSANEKEIKNSYKLKTLGAIAESIQEKLTAKLQNTYHYLNTLSEADDSEVLDQKILGRSVKELKEAMKIIEHLRDFSSSNQVEKSPLNLQEELISSIEFLKTLAPPNVNISFKSKRTSSFIINGNRAAIRSILIEFSKNAFYAMKKNGGNLTFEIAEKEKDAADLIVLKIRDTGEGIAEVNFKRLFDPLFSTKAGNFGAGLGLPRAKSLIDSHYGNVSFISSVEKGTEFTVEFPKYKPENSKNQRGLALNIDEDETFSKLTELYLNSVGLKSKSFLNAEEAVNWYENSYHEVDIVLLDLPITSLTPKKLINDILKINPGTPIAISAEVLTKDIKKLTKDDNCKFFRKPNSYPSLISWIAEVLPGS